MVVPFDKQQQIHARYQMLSEQPVSFKSLIEKDENNNDDISPMDGQQYATFMRSLTTNNTWNPNEKLNRPKKNYPTRSSRSPTNTVSTTVKALPKDSTNKSPKSAPSVLSVQEIKKKNEEEHKKKLKAIEDYMLVCKQEERDLKRVEGDIVKKERNLKKTMKSYESDIYDVQRQQESEMTNSLKEEERIKQQYNIEDEKITKDRIARNTAAIQRGKESDSKACNKMNGLEFQFENIAEAIERKRQEVSNLVKEFEMKLKQKEEEEFRLKKEFANVSLELNMEAQKQRIQSETDKESTRRMNTKDISENTRRSNELDEKKRAHKEKIGLSERTKRRYSKDLHDMNGVMSMQAREDRRRLKDVKVKLQANSTNMKEAQIKAQLLQMERQGKQSEEKVMAVNARRREIQDLITQQRKQKNDQTTDEFRMRHFVVNHELKKQDLKDNIQHFQKVVDRHEEAEHGLYHQVRHLESERRKQEQNVLTLKQQLMETQKQNKLLLKETALRCHQTEKELEQRLQKEEAQLGRALAEREEKIQALAKYRGASKEEKHMLDEQKKVHDRLVRIEKKSNFLRQSDHQRAFQSAY